MLKPFSKLIAFVVMTQELVIGLATVESKVIIMIAAIWIAVGGSWLATIQAKVETPDEFKDPQPFWRKPLPAVFFAAMLLASIGYAAGFGIRWVVT